MLGRAWFNTVEPQAFDNAGIVQGCGTFAQNRDIGNATESYPSGRRPASDWHRKRGEEIPCILEKEGRREQSRGPEMLEFVG